MLCILLTGALVRLWLIKSITRPLKQAIDITKTVVLGDLRAHIEVAGRDKTAQLMAAAARYEPQSDAHRRRRDRR